MEGIYTIGKEDTCDIHFAGRFIEKQHARLTVSGEEVMIEDLGSQFGTFVNGQRINETRSLLPKDKVKIGTQLLDWEAYSEGVESAMHDPNPIYFKDLFSIRGRISRSNYLFILLFFAVSPLLIFFGVPAVLVLIKRRGSIDLDHLIEPLWWLFGLLTLFIFFMQSIKRYRTYRTEK